MAVIFSRMSRLRILGALAENYYVRMRAEILSMKEKILIKN